MSSCDYNELEIRVDNEGWNKISNPLETVNRSFQAGLECAGMMFSDVGATIILADNIAVRQLNRQWRDKKSSTNILSFPAPANEKTETGRHYLGDMILAYETVNDEAEKQSKAFETHLCHLVIHGALHLLGYDHQNDDDATKMEDLERTAMTALNLPDPYLPSNQVQEKIES